MYADSTDFYLLCYRIWTLYVPIIILPIDVFERQNARRKRMEQYSSFRYLLDLIIIIVPDGLEYSDQFRNVAPIPPLPALRGSGKSSLILTSINQGKIRSRSRAKSM
jgi:hypothetical protein